MISDDFKWNSHLTDCKDSLTKQLTKRINAMRKLRPFINNKLIKQIANCIFESKFNYSAELWIGAPNYQRKKIQTLQLQACIITLRKKNIDRISAKMLLTEMNWLSVNDMLALASSKMTHSVLNFSKPEVLNYIFKSHLPLHAPETRMSGPQKLGNMPPNFGQTNYTKKTYRFNAYTIYPKIPEVITQLKDPKKFKISLKKYYQNPKNLL